MKLRVCLSLRRCLLACLAGLGGLSPAAGTTLTAEGVTYGDELNSSRFFDTGKGYYFSWDSYFWPELNKLYKQYGNFSFLGDVYDRIPSSTNQLDYDSITDDSDTCWAQVSMNLVEYWHSYYGVFCNDPRKLIYGRTYDHKFLDATGGTLSLKQNLVFIDTFTNAGDSIRSYLDWMMLGYENPWYTKIEQSGNGGFWDDYFFTNSHNWGCDLVDYADISGGSISSLTSGLLRLLGFTRQADGSYEQTTKGQLVYVGMTGISGGGHAITCHGVELDANGQVMAMYVTNSDDMEYKLFKLYIKVRNGAIALYENEACTELWEYAGTGWVIDAIESIRTPEALKTKLAQYENAENPLRWTGAGSTWKTHPSTAIADALPDDSTGWNVEVDGEYFPIYYLDSKRKVEFNDSASSGRVQVEGSVVAAEMILNNRSLSYEFSGGQIAADTLTAHTSGISSLLGVSVSGSQASLRGYTLSLGKGASMAYTTAVLGSGSNLMFNGGSAQFTMLTMSSGSSIELVASSSLTSSTLQASSGVSFVFSSANAILTFTGSISASAPITLIYEPDIDINGQSALIKFTKGLSNWSTCFKVTDGVLSYANNTLYFTYVPLQLDWTSGSGTWSPSLWKGAAQETMGALAKFGGSSSYTVTINGAVVPAQVEVGNSAGSITFGGSGSITGNTRLSKSDAGTLIINNANSYTGGTNVIGGTLQVGHVQALGSGDVSLQNATLNLNNKALANAIYSSGTSTISNGGNYAGSLTMLDGSLSGNINLSRTALLKGGEVSAVLSGAGGVNISGSVTISGANRYSGGSILASADVSVRSSSAFGSGSISSSGNTSVSVASGTTLSLAKTISNVGALTLKGSFDVSSLATQSISDSRVDVSGKVGRSGFLCSGGYTVQVVNGGSVAADKANLFHNGNKLAVDSDGQATFAGTVDYTSYLVAAGTNVGVKTIKSAALAGGSSSCNIELKNGTLSLDSNVSGALTLSGGTLVLDGARKMVVDGALTLSSASWAELASGFYQDGTYTLISAAGGILLNGSLEDCLTVRNPGTRTQYSFYVQGDDLKLDIVTRRLVLMWGGAKKGIWGNEQSAFWSFDGEAASFANGDEVEFNQQTSVTLVGEVIPGDITVSSDASVSFVADKVSKGCIAGHASLIKSGAGVLTITADNDDWEGNISVRQGTLKAGHDDAFGNGVIEVSNGATLDFAGKKVDAYVTVTGSACLKNGKNFEGYLTLQGDLAKGSLVAVAPWAVAEWCSGEINGTISGSGELIVMGEVSLGLTGKMSVEYLTLGKNSKLSVSSKGMMMNTKHSLLTMTDAYLVSDGKLGINELQMTGGEISIDTAKAMSLDIKGKTTSRLVDNGRIRVAGKMSVAGNLELAGAASIRLYDPSGKNKAMPLAVKGTLTLGSGSTLTLSGALSAKDMVLDGGTINLTSNKPLTIKVGNRLDINGPVDLNLGFTVADKDVNKKSFKILTFKSSNLGGEEELYDLLGLSDSYCTLSFDKKKTSVMLTVTDKEAWDAYIADEETEAPTATTALVNPALPDYSGVADALVQANWGLVESSRAFVNAIGNRSMAVQLGSGEHAVWASAIAGASRRSSSGTHGGADTNITGGAIGMETQLGENSLLGMALGNSWTRVSAHNYGTIKQDTTHLGVYGQTNWNKLSADWSAAYGRSESKFNGSDWSQRAIQLDGRLSYNHALSETVLLRGFGGVQYYASDSARVDGLDAGEVQNLRGEIGVGIVRSTQKSSVYAELALHQDIVRDNPEVRSPFGQRYHGTNPGRTGINLTIGGSYALSDQWSVNASYTAEVVENANAHSVNVGATYKF